MNWHSMWVVTEGYVQAMLAPEAWAEHHFATVDLGDARRTKRAVKVAAQMTKHPAGSVPQQNDSWGGTKATYRLCDCEDVTFEKISEGHWQRTREEAESHPAPVLFLNDTTQVDFTKHRRAKGLGPIGDGNGQGFLLHSALGIGTGEVPDVLGVMHQSLYCRKPKRKGETRAQRKARKRESQKWPETINAIGAPPEGASWIHVCDREADVFETFDACRGNNTEFIIRASQNRRVALGHGAEEPDDSLLDLSRRLKAVGHKQLKVRSRPHRKPRIAKLRIAFAPVTVFCPRDGSQQLEPVPCWVVRVWEENTPKGEDPIEWVLLTSRRVRNRKDAEKIAEYYSHRWMVEEYHKCLKTGCSVEKSRLEEGHRLGALIGVLAVVAARLLALKHMAHHEPDEPAGRCVSMDHVRVLAAYTKKPIKCFTVYHFWREVARLGGFLGRKHDGEPGWQTIWRGWQKLDLMVLGARLKT